MTALFLKISRILDRAAVIACGSAALVLVVMVLVNVVLRYGFGTGSIKMQDLAAYAFAVLVITSVPVCLARGGHVRVEVLSERLSPGYLRGADAVALVLFLIPLFGLVIWAGWNDLTYSWSIREGAVTPGGLGGLWLVKSVLPLASVMMIWQGVAVVLNPPTPVADAPEVGPPETFVPVPERPDDRDALHRDGAAS
ncbi:TRAP transporter small permease subunit [Roseicitreum antarcticum]|uniref:TRAP transporter small permease protein n=1 Tax=Roseicitreum antarcticum TaxID=564137 RepID=A0A1H3BE24_9RHOB|nr:TRAP transporter small permease subunit [Roseicitreum antarcticum]SDX40203.1 TRAP-type mannitol/chloroaromatic compound transport system, small permease component [Roseicitreum antarcticum]